ncbi:zinc dependent phospholipase C family protein [Mesorhizobium sp.]|uniref:zinc dependent phospholipase C family protein n=1 Tax=Mesorhizobium sp. TaxID=1871066 RepID=UPI003BAD72F1
MLIAHLPSGYILGAFAQDGRQPGSAIMAAALVGSVAPDFDMFYFHFVDGGRTHHHDYITHWPLFWAASGLIALALARWCAPRQLAVVATFFVAAMLHMVLDTVASPIMWLMPFDRHSFEWVRVPAVYRNWVFSFVLHWTFVLELLICGGALVLAFRRSRFVGGQSENCT